MLVDSHAHLDSFAAPGEADGVVLRARDAGVEGILAVGGSGSANACSCTIAARYPGLLRAAVGFDRDQATLHPDLASLRTLARDPTVAALGEMGLDYYYQKETAVRQMALFREQLAMARECVLPVVVHSRDADEDTLKILREHADAWPGEKTRIGVLHCFTRGMAFADVLLDLGMMLSFSGIITFKNADALREVAVRVPEDRLLIETDTPYLAPVPHRGKGNEPAYLALVADALAKIRNDSADHIAHITAQNAKRLFSF